METRRTEARYHDGAWGLREWSVDDNMPMIEGKGFDDVPGILRYIGEQGAKIGVYALDGVPPVAVSLIHELRFYGHGQAGGDGVDATFKFADSHITESALTEPARKSKFGVVRAMMAPGSSILLEGCETGQGPAGKRFLQALGELLLGPTKWGFLRASTRKIAMSPGTHPP